MMRLAILLVVLLSILVTPVRAQDDTRPLLERLDPTQVWRVDYVLGMDVHELTVVYGRATTIPMPTYYDMRCMAETMKQLRGTVVTGDWKAQPYSWNFVTNEPRKDWTRPYASMMFWQWDAEKEYARRDYVVAFEVGYPDRYEVVLQQGDLYVQFHFNNWYVDKQHAHAVFEQALACKKQ